MGRDLWTFRFRVFEAEGWVRGWGDTGLPSGLGKRPEPWASLGRGSRVSSGTF